MIDVPYFAPDFTTSMVTRTTPNGMPIAHADAALKSMMRPAMNGPRSFIVTITDRPLR
jgi:hypothetical protein